MAVQARWVWDAHDVQNGGHDVENREAGLGDRPAADVEHGIVVGMHADELLALVGEGLLVERTLGIVAVMGSQAQVCGLLQVGAVVQILALECGLKYGGAVLGIAQCQGC